MSILMPSLSRVSDQAKATVCLNNLHQWGLIWKMYLDDNGNIFPGLAYWFDFLEEYWKDDNLLFCPIATKTAVPPSSDERHATKKPLPSTTHTPTVISTEGPPCGPKRRNLSKKHPPTADSTNIEDWSLSEFIPARRGHPRMYLAGIQNLES